jgi:hypothetical protein
MRLPSTDAPVGCGDSAARAAALRSLAVASSCFWRLASRQNWSQLDYRMRRTLYELVNVRKMPKNS